MSDGPVIGNQAVPAEFESWSAYWTSLGMPWRTEAAIGEERQRFLAARRDVAPDVREGIYPFKNVPLSRADIEWLLATHDHGRGPVHWDDESQRERVGLDLRGAHLRSIDLSRLPLARTLGGLSLHEMNMVARQAQALEAAALCIESVHAFDIDLRDAILVGAQFEDAQFTGGHLECATLLWAHFKRVRFHGTHLEAAHFILASLEDVQAPGAHFEGASLSNVRTTRTDFFQAHFEGAGCNEAHFEGARLVETWLHGADLSHARLEGAALDGAHLDGKALSDEEIAPLRRWKPDFPSVLPPADLRGAVLDTETSLARCVVGNERFGGISLVDARLSDTNLAVVDWLYTENRFLGRRVKVFELGDERDAHRPITPEGKPKTADQWMTGYQDAVRANRQLVTALRNQGVNDIADKFAYRAQVLQRAVLRLQGRRLTAAGSWLLDFVSGYGYEPVRSLITYIIVILGFAIAYKLLGNQVNPPLGPLDAVVFSVTSFHGRGFSPGEVVSLHNPLTVLAAFEAIIGLLIEITFIATFTQRFFAR